MQSLFLAQPFHASLKTLYSFSVGQLEKQEGKQVLHVHVPCVQRSHTSLSWQKTDTESSIGLGSIYACYIEIWLFPSPMSMELLFPNLEMNDWVKEEIDKWIVKGIKYLYITCSSYFNFPFKTLSWLICPNLENKHCLNKKWFTLNS